MRAARPRDAMTVAAAAASFTDMRQGSLLARLRGEDGRSLARALVVLVLVSLFAGGLSAGSAAAEGRTVLCAASVDRDVGTPAGHPGADCCVAGVMPLGLALATLPPEPGAPEPVAAPEVRHAVDAHVSPASPGHATARGPPLSA